MTRKQRKAVYTFIIGNYDELKTPNVSTIGWDYICFTDNPNLKSDFWDVRMTYRHASELEMEDKKFAMKHMILFHQLLKGYDLSVSIGGQIQINSDLDKFIEKNFGEEYDMMVCKHPERTCIYDEAEVCKEIGKDTPQRINDHMQKYREAGYPPNNGLYATAIMGMRHDRPNLIAMCELWWNELLEGSRRDQLSLNYAIWKSSPIKIAELNFNDQFYGDQNFLISPHYSVETYSPIIIKESTPQEIEQNKLPPTNQLKPSVHTSRIKPIKLFFNRLFGKINYFEK